MGGVKQKDSDGHIFCRFHLNIIIEENVFFLKKKNNKKWGYFRPPSLKKQTNKIRTLNLNF